MKTRKYDPSWMIKAIDAASHADDGLTNNPEMVKLIKDTLLNCPVVKSKQDDHQYCYYNFVDGSRANQQGSEWQFQESIDVYVEGADFIFDLLKDGRIGGVEIQYSWRNTQDFKNS